MTLHQEWVDLTQSQTDETFEEFWREYAAGEGAIYSAMLTAATEKLADAIAKKKEDPDASVSGLVYEGTIKDLADTYDVRPVIVMGFLDGLQTSLNKEFKLEKLKEDDAFKLDIDFEKLYFNMHKADARHLYSLPEWDEVLTRDQQVAIAKDYRRSKQVIKPKKVGRNDPCPCGSGKKYKHCCMAKDQAAGLI